MPTNINFLQKLANHKDFESGNVETHFIEHHKDDLFADPANSLIAKEAYGDARLSAVFAAACICEEEYSTLKESPHGKFTVQVVS